MNYVVIDENGQELKNWKPIVFPLKLCTDSVRLSYKDKIKSVIPLYLKPKEIHNYCRTEFYEFSGCWVRIDSQKTFLEESIDYELLIIGSDPIKVQRLAEVLTKRLQTGKKIQSFKELPKLPKLKSFWQRLKYFSKWLFVGEIDDNEK